MGEVTRVQNEFAAVDIEVIDVPSGRVLRIADARTGLEITLDALEIEALTRLRKADLEQLVYTSAGPLVRLGFLEHQKESP